MAERVPARLGPHAQTVRPRADGRLDIRSAQDESGWAGGLDDIGARRPRGWFAYVAGVPWALDRLGRFLTLYSESGA